MLTLVEVLPSLLTDSAAVERATGFAAEQLGKEPIAAHREQLFAPPPQMQRFVAAEMLEARVGQRLFFGNE